ncbi:C2 family cysteine protease [Cystobacter fuscus]
MMSNPHAQPQWNTPVGMGQNPYAQVQNHTLYGRGGPQPKHVRQSNLGDCHVLAAMAGVASDPNAIRHMVQEQTPGVYQVNLHDPTTLHPVQVHVDATLPEGMEASFHRSRRQPVIWPHMVEKGYAKLHDANETVYGQSSGLPTRERQVVGYDDLAGGTGAPAMRAFTGRQADYMSIRSMPDQVLVDHLSQANTPGVAVVAGSNALDSNTMSSRVLPAHAYTVTGTRISRSTGEVMVGLRNPHGGTQHPVLGTVNDTFELPLRKFRASFETVTYPVR